MTNKKILLFFSISDRFIYQGENIGKTCVLYSIKGQKLDVDRFEMKKKNLLKAGEKSIGIKQK